MERGDNEVELPRVAGRHRNTAVAAERRRRAVELVLRGMTYQQVAHELGYANRGTVHRIVATALREREAESIDDLRVLELDRLDALQSTYWFQATGGDIRAAMVVLKIMDRRARLLGLYESGAFTTPAPPTCIVDYSELSEIIANQGHPPDKADI